MDNKHNHKITSASPEPSANSNSSMKSIENAQSGCPHGFSSIEIKLLRKIANGCSFQNISEALDISELTINTCLKNLATRLNAQSLSHVIAIAFRQGLVD